VTSAYLDILMPLPNIFPTCLVDLVKYAELNNIPIILGIDSNAHSSLWGPDTNRRGEVVEDFILEHGLLVENKGKKPTFVARGTKTCIDITLSKNLDLVQHWEVSDELTFSDHCLITFSVTFGKCDDLGEVFDFKKANWQIFRDCLASKPFHVPYIITEAWLDFHVDKLKSDIESALKQACPVRRMRHNTRRASFWTKELYALRQKARAAFRAYRRSESEPNWAEYLECKREFRRGLRSSKRESWRNFTSDVSNPTEMTKLTKLLQGKKNHSVGLMARDGTGLCTPESTVNLLIDVHFPGNIPIPGEVPVVTKITDLNIPDLDFISLEKVIWSIKSFGPEKAAGPDGLKPKIIQQLGIGLERLLILYRASVALGYVPSSWRKSKVIFIPKPGRDDYSKAKSFRPISLTSFLFKALERIILAEVEDSYLSVQPLHRDQHAFHKGSSCDSALSDMVDEIERSILNNQYSIGVFLDIEGAFDNLDPEAVLSGMRDKCIPDKIMKWYGHYLKNRTIVVDLKGVHATRGLTKGTPQGGVLSPLAWNLAFDQLLALFNEGPVHIKGFADDAALIVSGPDLNTLVCIMQDGLNKAINWGRKHGLRFGAAKTVSVIFSRRRFAEPKRLTVDGLEILYSNEVKYLGITLDYKLSFGKHVEGRLKKAKALLFKLRNGIGQLWGPSPCHMRWAYTSIVRPMISYGSLVWGHMSTKYERQFQRLQRLACMTFVCIPPSAPTRGLEVITNLQPLDLHIRGEALKAAKRVQGRNPTRWDGVGSGARRGHLLKCNVFQAELSIPDLHLDYAPVRSFWNKSYMIDYSSFTLGLPDKSDLTCYTDGSLRQATDGPCAGWGYVIKATNKTVEKSGGLGLRASVFQAEITAIIEVCKELREMAGDVVIHVDSTGVLRALDGKYHSSSLLQQCCTALNELGRDRFVTLSWIKAHAGHDGNERADSLARSATDFPSPIPTTVSPTYYKELVRERVLSKWARRWRSSREGRQTKLFVPSPNSSWSKKILSLDRETLYLLILCATGHNYLNYHMYNLGRTAQYMCRLCNESREESWHLVAECPALVHARGRIFSSDFLTSPPPIDKLLSFLRVTHIDSFLYGTGVEQTL